MRLNEPDEQAHHCDVQNPQGRCLLGRFSRHRTKEYAFTWGGLSNHELDWEKSADTIVGEKKRAIERKNLMIAYKSVVGNKGSSGVDGLETKDLRVYLNDNWPSLKDDIVSNGYFPFCSR